MSAGRERLWHVPALHTEGDAGVHRRVTWLELFFDLAFVVAIAKAAHGVAEHPSWGGVGAYAVTFLPIFWTWNAATYYAERFETEGLETRLIAFLQMLVVAGLAANAHHATSTSFAGFALAYAAGRVLMTVLWGRAGVHVPAFRPVAARFVTWFGVSIALVLASVLADGPVRWLLFGAALLVDVATPLSTLRRQRTLPRFSDSKLPERFGLFTILVLGEAVAGAIAGLADAAWTPRTVLAGALAMAVAFALWWLYFDFAGRRTPRPTVGATLAWTYLHMMLAMALAASGATLAAVVPAAGVVDAPVRAVVAGGAGLAVVVIGLLDRVLVRADDEPTHGWAWALLTAVGAAVAALSVAPLTAAGLLGGMVALLAVAMGYGLWVWVAPMRLRTGR